MRMGPAGKKWTGSYGFGIPGYPDDTLLTKEMPDDPKPAIAIMKAIAGREAGKSNTLREEQWTQAYEMFKAGRADIYPDGKPAEKHLSGNAEIGPTGAGLLRRGREHIGERYIFGALAPKDDPHWTGPCDCAEFVSWLVYQEAGQVYGCVDDNAKPAQANAYTGAWRDDVTRLGKRVSVEEAASTVGGILLRYPAANATGHIVLCDGAGGTVEAMDRKHGVVAGTVHDRRWDTGVLIPGISYDGNGGVIPRPPAEIYRRNEPNMDHRVVMRIQEALAAKGILDRSQIDGEFERSTEDAVVTFQRTEGLVVDGEVGPDTAGALGIVLKPGGEEPAPDKKGTDTQQGGMGGPDETLGGSGGLKGGTGPLTGGLGVGAMNPLILIAARVLPDIVKAIAGDKAGVVVGEVAKAVADIAGTKNPEEAREKLNADPAAVAALQLKLAEITAAQEEARQKAQFDLLKAQFEAEAKKREAALEQLRVEVEDTKGARAAFSALAQANNPMAWGAPIVSILVTIGFSGC